MAKHEKVSEFYTLHGVDQGLAGRFNVHRRGEFACDATSLPPNRRDFYKISLITEGEGVVSYADKVITINRPALTFFNPLIPYSWEPTVDRQAGYFCLFTEEFVSSDMKHDSLNQSPLFKSGGDHVFFPPAQSMTLLSSVFENMLSEMARDYVNKYDLLKSYVQIVMHEALKLQPISNNPALANASQRISTLFLDLLERQFPLDSPHQVLSLKNAAEFAAYLAVHPNHLNKALKEATGKTTRDWINSRLAREAKSLLLHSNWDIAEIAHCLGFEHSSSFNTFFKTQVLQTPGQFRKAFTSNSKLFA